MTVPDKDNKKELFLATYMDLQPFIYRVARCYAVGGSEEMQDLFQDISSRLWEKYDTFQGQSQLNTWFFRVILNTAMEHKRHTAIRPKLLSFNTEMPVAMENDETQQMLDELYSIIRKLDPEERAIVDLYLEEKNYDEIGAVMNLTPSNVGVKLHRIRQKMKNIKEHLYD